jgi:hypothetical protein
VEAFMGRTGVLVGVVLAAMVVASPALGAQAPRAGASNPGSAPQAGLQVTQGGGRVEVLLASDENAEQVRERLRRLLQQYPTTLSEVLRRDPSLLHNDAYLAPYPALAAFLNQHPDVGHNPTYFFGSPQRDSYANFDPSSQKLRTMDDMFGEFAVLLGFVGFFTLVGFVTKAVIDQRRWSRVSKVQTEAHTKVMDRLTSNEDLLAYVQSPAGQRYLESAPLSLGRAEGPVSAPYSRILWSVQAGTVASVVGLGFLFVSARWAADPDWSGDFSRMLFLVGVLLLAAGVGFVLSGAASYTLSRRFGLIQRSASNHA